MARFSFRCQTDALVYPVTYRKLQAAYVLRWLSSEATQPLSECLQVVYPLQGSRPSILAKSQSGEIEIESWKDYNVRCEGHEQSHHTQSRVAGVGTNVALDDNEAMLQHRGGTLATDAARAARADIRREVLAYFADVPSAPYSIHSIALGGLRKMRKMVYHAVRVKLGLCDSRAWWWGGGCQRNGLSCCLTSFGQRKMWYGGHKTKADSEPSSDMRCKQKCTK